MVIFWAVFGTVVFVGALIGGTALAVHADYKKNAPWIKAPLVDAEHLEFRGSLLIATGTVTPGLLDYYTNAHPIPTLLIKLKLPGYAEQSEYKPYPRLRFVIEEMKPDVYMAIDVASWERKYQKSVN